MRLKSIYESVDISSAIQSFDFNKLRSHPTNLYIGNAWNEIFEEDDWELDVNSNWVYRGDTSPNIASSEVYVTPNPLVAEQYASTVWAYKLLIPEILDITDLYNHLLPLHISIEDFYTTIDQLKNTFRSRGIEAVGYIADGHISGTEIFVFDPSKLKLLGEVEINYDEMVIRLMD